MEADDQLEMLLLQEQVPGEYRGLLQLMDKGQPAAFASLLQRGLRRQPPTVEVDRLLPHPLSMSLLDKAASEDRADFVQLLLEAGADPNLLNPERRRAPVHLAAEAGSAGALAALLAHPAIRPNLLVSQMTGLHYAVNANCEACARLLLEAGASPNVPNSKGLTALHLAAERSSRGMVQLMLEHAKLLDLDSFRDRRGETTRALIQRKFSDLRLPAQSDGPDDAALLRYYLTANDEAGFSERLRAARELRAPDLAELLRLSVERDLVQASAELLARPGADGLDLLELARLAVERARPRALGLLLGRAPGMAGRLLLPACQELGVPAPGDRRRLRCLELLLGQPGLDVRQEDDKGNSPLHYAARAECREALELLLARGSHLGHANGFGAPPLAHMTPAVLEEQLDRCLGSSNERTEDYEIVMDFRNLVPHRSGAAEAEALLYIAGDKGLRHLLKHPLLDAFLYLKYLRIRHLLYLNFALYLVFYCLLVAYVWLMTAAEDPGDPGQPATSPRENASDAGPGAGPPTDWQGHPLLSALLALSLAYLLIRESLQLASAPLGYLAAPDNWLELGLIGLTLALLLGAGREIGALAILISTWELVVLMAQHPRMSTDIEMFKTVTLNFAKFLFLYMFLIVAFAFAFYVLFNGHDNFADPLGSLFKTVIMLTGELDSGELPFATYPLLSRAVFIGFVFLVVIILLNLLNGLAVNDTAEILAEAELVGLVSRTRLVAYAERALLGGPPSGADSWLRRLGRGLGCLGCLGCRGCRGRPGGGSSRAPDRSPDLSPGRGPLRFVARRVLLFPRYLPHARLSVKPLKSHEITLHGRSRATSRCSALSMHPLVAQRAKRILAERERQSAEDKIMERLEAFDARFDGLQTTLLQVARSLSSLAATDRPPSPPAHQFTEPFA